MAVEPLRRTFTADEYEHLIETGFFKPDERLELIDGEIITMSPIGTRHAACVARLTHLLASELGRRALVWVQNPIVLGDRDMPQPDLAILRWRDDYYAGARPGGDSTWWPPRARTFTWTSTPSSDPNLLETGPPPVGSYPARGRLCGDC